MSRLIAEFDFHRVMVAPWTESLGSYGWIFLMGFLVAAACGLVGNYLLLRRMALVGDAISHSVLPGMAVAFLLSGSRSTWAMFAGALAAGVLTTLLIEAIQRWSRIKQDAAIGITFSSLFAVGVILISLFASRVDLDQDCVLYGEIGFVPLEPLVQVAGRGVAPPSVVRMAVVALLTVLLVVLFYKELLVSSFDPGLSISLGVSATAVHYALMAWLSVVVVSAFEAVGAILVIAMLILPGATAAMLSDRLTRRLWLTVVHAGLSALSGVHLSVWLECSVAGAMVVMAAGLFGLAWVFGPHDGLLRRWWWRRDSEAETAAGA